MCTRHRPFDKQFIGHCKADDTAFEGNEGDAVIARKIVNVFPDFNMCDAQVRRLLQVTAKRQNGQSQNYH